MKKLSLALGMVLVAALLPAQEKKADEKAAAPAAGKALRVKLNYTGEGKVDDKHKIVLFIFDSPDFSQGTVMPIGTQNASAKDAVVAFDDVAATPVYLVAIFDPTGGYDGMSMPPSGSSLGLYFKTAGTPEPIKLEAGKPTQVELPFDDTVKMP